jgi:hypothetical protein
VDANGAYAGADYLLVVAICLQNSIRDRCADVIVISINVVVDLKGTAERANKMRKSLGP